MPIDLNRGRLRDIVAVQAWCLMAAVTSAQLPDESQLPGSPAVVSPAAALPTESQLPGAGLAPIVADPSGASLPSESALPTSILKPETDSEPSVPAVTEEVQPPDTPEAADQAPPDLLRIEESPDQRPWLTLRTRSPLNLVRTLAFSPDSQQLFVAGDDKTVLVYRRFLPAQEQEAARWGYEKTLRWQVQRGPRGSIFALQPLGGNLAFGGYGAMGELGEIVVANPATGDFRHVLRDFERGNRHRITSIAAPPQAKVEALAVMDTAGTLVYWRRDEDTGGWQATTLVSDTTTAVPLASARTLHPITMPDDDHVLAPLLAGTEGGVARWTLQLIDVSTRASRAISVPGPLHQEMVTALASTSDGKLWASADAQKNIFLWQSANGRVTRLPLPSLGRIVTSLAFGDDGSRLLAGTLQVPGGPQQNPTAAAARLQVWDVSNPSSPRNVTHWDLPDDCFAVAVSRDGLFAAASAGSAVTLYSLSGEKTAVAHWQPEVHIPRRVAFPKTPPLYRIGLSQAVGEGADAANIEQYFDTQQVQLRRPARLDPAEWLQADGYRGAWGLDTEELPGGRFRYWLTRDGQRAAQLPLDSALHGTVTATCWVPDAEGQPVAVAVGTSGESHIYLFRLADEGRCPLLRQFRGHTGAVLSIGCSQDRKYLVSSAKDGVICVWRCDGDMVLSNADVLRDRWGAQFAVDAGRLVVSDVRAEGPLYFRGLRAGDEIVRLQLPEERAGRVELTSLQEPDAMLAAFRQNAWDRMIAIDFRRGRAAERSFQSFPAWQPVVSLFIDPQQEWAYWAPSGHYDASFEGHKLFGWQVNRGPELPPDFFLAAEVRAALERPRVMSHLLEAGSLEEAFRQAQLQPPANAQWALRDQYRLLPRIELLSPLDGAIVEGPSTLVQATVRIAKGQRLRPPKLFANGVVAAAARQRDVIQDTGGETVTWEWQARLPADRRIALQVVAATEEQLAATHSIQVQRADTPRSVRPRLYVLAAGVGNYRDAQIPRLRTPTQTSRQLLEALSHGASAFYRPQMMSLLDQHVTVPAWRVALEQGVARLRDSVSPDDVLLIFLSGHGIKDSGSGRYYYLSSEARYADVMARRYENCVSFDDLALYSDVPCRKLVILDTCHSGAVQPLSQSQLKAALRMLQDDLVLTLTASEGDQEAVEGRFGERLIEALNGRADGALGSADGQVSFPELVDYVRRTVMADSAGDAFQQSPTAGPQELLELVELPLTQAKSP